MNFSGRMRVSRAVWKRMRGSEAASILPEGHRLVCECGKTVVIPNELQGKGIDRAALGRIWHEEPRCAAFVEGFEALAAEAEAARERVRRAWEGWKETCARPGVTELEKHDAWVVLRNARGEVGELLPSSGCGARGGADADLAE